MKRLSKKSRKEAEELLDLARHFQTELWDTLGKLETLLDCEIDANVDLEGYDVDTLHKTGCAA